METTQGAEAVVTTSETPTQTPELSTPAAAPAENGGAPGEVTQPTQTAEPAPVAPPGQERQTHRPSRVDRRNAELSRRNRELEDRILRLEGAVSVRPQAEAAPQGEADPEPDPAKFPGGEYGREYWQAWNRWDRRQAAKEEAEKSTQRQASEKQQQAWDEAGQRFQSIRRTAEEAGYEDGADFLDALIQREDFDVADDITDMDNAAAVAQFLGSEQRNPKMEAWRQHILKSLGGSRTKRVRELTRLDDALSEHFATKRAQAATPSNNAPPNSPPPNPKVVPMPTPQANGRAATPGDADSGYDRAFKR